MSFLTAIKEALTGAAARQPARHTGEYMRGGRTVLMKGWQPALRETNDDIGAAWDKAAARTLDLIHNSGFIAGAIDQAVANTVGTGLRLKAMPENETFGMSNVEAKEWARRVEQRFELWSRNELECDIEATRTFGQMQAAAFRMWLATGEILAETVWKPLYGGMYGTKIRLLPPWRLSRKTDEWAGIINGVRVNPDGRPIGYIAIRKPRDRNSNLIDEFEVQARDRAGRPRVVHVFDGVPGQRRGITPMAPALQTSRQFDQLADATLTAAIVQTVFAASIKGDLPTEEEIQALLTPQEQQQIFSQGVSPVGAYMDMAAGFYDGGTIDVGINGRIAHLFPGQELEFHTATHSASNYKDFANHLLREIARCLGLTYESATGDYEGATYSSVRMATGEIFQITKYRRENIVARFCQPFYEAWLEEEVAKGRIPFPGGYGAFLANRAAACRAAWRGSPKPQADDLKTAKAHEVWKRLGVMTDQMICDDLGVDVEDVYMQRAQEKEMQELYGLEDLSALQITGPLEQGGGDDREGDTNA